MDPLNFAQLPNSVCFTVNLNDTITISTSWIYYLSVNIILLFFFFCFLKLLLDGIVNEEILPTNLRDN